MIYDFAELYDEQYAFYREDIPFYTRLADDYGGKVLELGSGTGRLSLALARAGHQVTGIELAEAMYQRALTRLEEEKLSEQVTFLQADMRDFHLAETFDVIIAPFNTLMHAYTLADQDATFARVSEHLAPGGVFAFDLYNPNFSQLGTLRREAEWTHVGGEKSELFVYQMNDPDKQILMSRYYLDSVREDGSLGRRTATLTQRYYSRFELTRALAQAGLGELKLYGDFDKRRYSSAAPKMVGTAKIKKD